MTNPRLAPKPDQVTGCAAAGSCTSMASGNRYMLAMLCSNPAATKAAMGKTTATALSTTLRPAIAIQTAMQTSTLHRIPRANASSGGSDCFASAMRTTVRAIAPPFIAVWPLAYTRRASPAAPTKLAAATSTQLRSTSNVVIRPSAQAMASRLFPVNSSAPATTTSSSPSENTRPPPTCDAAKPSVASERTIT
jgi:hypothetical protein